MRHLQVLMRKRINKCINILTILIPSHNKHIPDIIQTNSYRMISDDFDPSNSLHIQKFMHGL